MMRPFVTQFSSSVLLSQEPAVHDGKTGLKEESQTKKRTHRGRQRRYVPLQYAASVHC